MKKIHHLMLAAALVFSVGADAFAASSTGNLAISAVVTAQCVVQSAAIPFGTYSSSAIQQNAQIGVTCSNGTSYTISLDAGTGSGANTTARKLATTDGSSTLNYALYQDSARTKTWGNANGTDTLSGVGNGAAQSIPVYGYIPAGQATRAGTYSDVVAITLSY
ncbi:Csu type fimbrial protein [Herbaspirillum robiniae]|uniref:Spore coat protein n=2 Tax=Herbaspirillum robiniae TaxID=2014887 RepID=A0A2D0B6G6_9BURK|nr:spore coat protein U domain-containing protein [Herbaspirillum robiniae]OWY29984.1 spore coat protein [Herbaspirillum robiniae]